MTEAEIRSRPFSLTRADYSAYYLSTYLRAFRTFPQAIWMWLVVAAPYTVLTFGELKAGHYVKAALVLAGIVIVWFAVIPGLGLLTLLGTLSRTHNAYLGRAAIVSPAKFTIEGQGFVDYRSWAQFREVVFTGRLIYLTMTGGVGMIVPNAAFATKSERDAFVAACRSHIAGSRHRQATAFDAPLPVSPLQEGAVETAPFKLGFGEFSLLMAFALLRSFTRPAMGIVAAGLLGFALWSQRVRLGAGDFSGLLILFAGAGLWLALFIPFMILLNWGLVRNKPFIRNPRRLAISPDNIRVHGEGFDFSTSWPSVRNVGRRFGSIQFWTGPAAAITVPLSTFPSAESAKAFQDQATAWWNAARKTST